MKIYNAAEKLISASQKLDSRMGRIGWDEDIQAHFMDHGRRVESFFKGVGAVAVSLPHIRTSTRFYKAYCADPEAQTSFPLDDHNQDYYALAEIIVASRHK